MKPWDYIVSKPVSVTITVSFAQDEYERLKTLAERRGISIETALWYMAAQVNNAPATTYGGTAV